MCEAFKKSEMKFCSVQRAKDLGEGGWVRKLFLRWNKKKQRNYAMDRRLDQNPASSLPDKYFYLDYK